MQIDNILRNFRDPVSSDLGVQDVRGRVEARLFEGISAPRVGRFILSERLGAGGMGTVYAAFDPQLGRKVAIKILHSDRAGDRLLREARALARLRHPNLLTLYEVSECQGQACIAMEYVEGRSLGDLQRSEHVPWRRWLALYAAAGRGLAAAHEAGLVHRDFKPDNVLLDRDGRVVVADFGLAKSRDDAPMSDDKVAPLSGTEPHARSRTQPGTRRYMAPEQQAGRRCDVLSDQFSFCASLWEALYGEAPLARDVAARGDLLAWRTLHEAPRRCPRWLHRALLRGLHPDPDRRWPSMVALIARLENDPVRVARRVVLWMLLVGILASLLVALRWGFQGQTDTAQARASQETEEQRARQAEREAAVEQQRSRDEWLILDAERNPDTTRAMASLLGVLDPEWHTHWLDVAVKLLQRPVSLAILQGHSQELKHSSFSPTGHHVAAASYDGTVSVWDARGHGDPLVLSGHTGRAHVVRFSPDGRYLVSTSADGTARVWDLARPGASFVLPNHNGPVYYAAFSPDGRRIATSSGDGNIRLWSAKSEDLAAGRPPQLLTGHQGEVLHVEWSPDGARLVSASIDGTARVWSLANPERSIVLEHDKLVYRAHFSPDGARIVTASEDDEAGLWRTRDGHRLGILDGHRGGVRDAVFSPDGTKLVTAGSSSPARLWRVDSGKPKLLRELPASGSGSMSVAFSPRGDKIAVALVDNCVQLWLEPMSESPVVLARHTGAIFHVEFDPRGELLLSSSLDKTVRIWDVSSAGLGATRTVLSHGPLPVAFAAAAPRFAVQVDARTISIHDRRSLRREYSRVVQSGDIRSIHLSPDARWLAASMTSGDLNIWDSTSIAPPARIRAPAPATFNFVDGDRVVVGRKDGTVSLYAASGELISKERRHDKEVLTLSALLAGRYVVSQGRDGRMIRWDVTRGLVGEELLHTDARLGVHAACSDGLVAAADVRHHLVYLRDVGSSASPPVTLDTGTGIPSSVALDCSHRLLMVQLRDGTMQVWSTESHRMLGENANLAASSVAFMAGAPRLVILSSSGELQIADVTNLNGARTIPGLAGILPMSMSLDNRNVLLIDGARELVRVELDTLLLSPSELVAKLQERTTVCPDLAGRRRLHATLAALLPVFACECAHGRTRAAVEALRAGWLAVANSRTVAR